MKITIKNLLLILAATMMVACDPHAPAEEDLFFPENDSLITVLTQDGKLYSLQGLKDSFMTEKGNYTDTTLEAFYRKRANNGDHIWYFSIDTFPTAGPGIYIMGRICTEDVGGNYYKSLVIQQMVDGEQQNLRISVDVGSIGGLYPIGQKILIRCNGLGIGKYSNQPQLCSPSYNNNIYAKNDGEKVGWQPGRIPGPQFYSAVTRIGYPSVDSLYYEELSLKELEEKYVKPYGTKPIECRKYDGRLVRLKGIHYNGTYENDSSASGKYYPSFPKLNVYVPSIIGVDSVGNPALDPYANVFAPTTTNLNYPQTRIVTDAEGVRKFKISNSEFAKFSHFFLPAHINWSELIVGGETVRVIESFDYAACQGSVTGILGYYVDKASTMTSAYDAVKPYNWSITPCGIEAFDFYDHVDQKAWVPVEFSKAKFAIR